MCLDRAHLRHKAGGHRVSELVILDMCAQTVPLLRKNIGLISHLHLINVTHTSVELVYSDYYPTANHEFINPVLPDWVVNNFPEIALPVV